MPKRLRRTTPTRRLVVAAVLAVLVLSNAACKDEPRGRGMLDLSTSERRQKSYEDLELIKRYDAGLQRTIDYARDHPELFPKDGVVELTAEQKQELRQIWRSLLDYMRALDGVKTYWREFARINPITEREDGDAHARAFLVAYMAWLVQYRHGLSFIDLTVPSKPLEVILDEPVPQQDIPADSFAALKWNIIHVKAVTQYLGGKQYYRSLHRAMNRLERQGPAVRWATATADQYDLEVREQLKERAAIQFAYNAFDIGRDFSFDAWFPVQRGVAEWMGDTKVKRLHSDLVDGDVLAQIGRDAQPGDIVVARHNWYLSNIGLPGFWPHAELYLGTPHQLASYFDDAEVRKWFKEQHGDRGLPQHLARAYPETWRAYDAGQDGQPLVVIEAVSEGVVFSTLAEACGADYVGVMRPRASKLDKARAIVRAFSLHGTPYDFNFDFLTDETLVCTELVYKSWHREDIERGPKLELTETMGRTTLPANDIVRQFDERHGTEGQTLDYVIFVDGREKRGHAVIATEADFRQSWKRPKWDVLQE